MTQHLQKQGDNYLLIINKAIADQAGLNEDAPVEVELAGEKLIVSRQPTSPFTAALEECNARYPAALKRLAQP